MTTPPPSIKCQVYSKYVAEQSQPDNKRYVFAYVITIKNFGNRAVQLLGRRWLITDSNGKQLTVEGEGVVGKQPIIAANDEYTYTSATAIETPVGVMQGQYIMLDTENNTEFTIEVEPFSLAIPNILN